MLVGVFGHVNHGKTTLVEHLTGYFCDVLPEERARGLTIELGFAVCTLPNGRRLSLIDAPGHEDFYRASDMASYGLDGALVVVSRREGVMPQTREHLSLLGALGIEQVVICASFGDNARYSLEALRRGLFDAGFDHPVVPVSADRSELHSGLFRVVASWRLRPRLQSLLLNITRIVPVKGRGQIARCTLSSGTLNVGDEVQIDAGPIAKVVEIQEHGVSRTTVTAPTRIGVRLNGDLPQSANFLSSPGTTVRSTHFDAQVSAALGDGSSVSISFGSARARAKAFSVETGPRQFARFNLDRPLALRGGMPFIARSDDNGSLLGAGEVVDALPQRRRWRKRARANYDPWLSSTGLHGLAPAAFEARLGRRACPLGTHIFSPNELERGLELLSDNLERWHHEHPDAIGAPLDVLKLGRATSDLKALAVQRELIVLRGRLVALPGFSPVDARDSNLERRLLRYLSSFGLRGGSTRQLVEETKRPGRDVKAALTHLKNEQRVFEIAPHHWLHGREARDLLAHISQQLEDGMSLSVPDLKRITNEGRNATLRLAEWLDRQGVCRRLGSVRVAGPRARYWAQP